MIKLFIAAGIPATLLIFGLKDAALYTGIIAFFVLFFSWIIKSNKQQPGESDEDYAKRMEKLKEKIKANKPDNNLSDTFINPVTDPRYSSSICNIHNYDRYK